MAFDVEAGNELANLAIKIYDRDLEKFRYQKSVMVNLVSKKTAIIEKVGQTLDIEIKGRYTASAVTATTGAFTVQEYTPSQVTLTIDQWFAVPISVVKKAAKQSYWNPKSTLPEEAAEALGERYDTDLFALGSTIAPVGDNINGGTLDEEMVLAMITRIAKRKIPRNALRFVAPEEGFWQGIAKSPIFRDADKTGAPQGIQTTGYVKSLYGIPFYTSTLNQKATNGKALQAVLFHESAYAIGMQYNNQWEMDSEVGAGRLADTYVVHSLYGTKLVRGDHAVLGNVAEYVETQ